MSTESVHPSNGVGVAVATTVVADEDAQSELARYDLLAAVGPTPSDRAVIETAWETENSSCLAERGFDMPVPVYTPNENYSKQQFERLRFDDIEQIKAKGYHGQWEIIPAVESDTTVTDDLPEGHSDTCKQFANKALNGGQDGAGATDPAALESEPLSSAFERELLEAQNDILDRFSTFEGLEDLRVAWSKCMSDSGYPNETFTDSMRVQRFMEQEVTPEEIDYALADSKCRGESGYRDALLGFIADEVAIWLRENEGRIAEYRLLVDAELERAKAILNSER